MRRRSLRNPIPAASLLARTCPARSRLIALNCLAVMPNRVRYSFLQAATDFPRT